jgi:hypothetical protein
MSDVPTRLWYRQLWPWLLIVPPAAAIIGGAITLYLAVTRPDAPIREDCRRDGVTMVCGDDVRRALETGSGRDPSSPEP